MAGLNVSTYYGPSASGSYGGGGGSSAWDTFGSFDAKFQTGQVPPSSGSRGTAQGPGASGAAQGPPAPPAEISNPLTGRVALNMQIGFVTFDGRTPTTGTAQGLLGELQKLFAYTVWIEDDPFTREHLFAGSFRPAELVVGLPPPNKD